MISRRIRDSARAPEGSELDRRGSGSASVPPDRHEPGCASAPPPHRARPPALPLHRTAFDESAGDVDCQVRSRPRSHVRQVPRGTWSWGGHGLRHGSGTHAGNGSIASVHGRRTNGLREKIIGRWSDYPLVGLVTRLRQGRRPAPPLLPTSSKQWPIQIDAPFSNSWPEARPSSVISSSVPASPIPPHRLEAVCLLEGFTVW